MTKKRQKPTPMPGAVEPRGIQEVLTEAKTEAKEEPKVETVVKEKKSRVKSDRITKKSVCVEMISRDGGATLDEIAREIAKRGIDDDLEVNRTTAGLWMHKLDIAVDHDKKSGKYFRHVEK